MKNSTKILIAMFFVAGIWTARQSAMISADPYRSDFTSAYIGFVFFVFLGLAVIWNHYVRPLELAEEEG
ncbi:MAG: hypothetical protein OCU12_07735 [Methanophagales archaeon]|nr:hypothetical protein [Methanophagales archaeon]